MGGSVEGLIEPFLRHMQGRGQTERNVRSFYGYPLRSVLLPFCANQGVDQVEDLTPELVDLLSLSIHQRLKADGSPISAATAAAYVKAMKYFLQWTGSERSKQLRPGALRRVHREVLTERDIEELEGACIQERNRLIIRTLYETGAREGGLASLMLDGLVARPPYYFVTFKDKTGERRAPVPAVLFRRLQAYVKSGRPRTSDRRLFIQVARRPSGGYEGLTEAGIYRVVKDAADRAGLGKRCYPHLLRHSAITRMVAAQMNPILISEITGVSVAVIARHYAHPSDDQLAEAMARLWR